MIKKNEGKVDRIIRILTGAAILSLAFTGPQSPWAYLGIVPLATGLIGWCPLYAILGISSCKAGACAGSTNGALSAGSACCGKN